MLVHSKKVFLLPSVCPGTEYNYLLVCFESYQGIPYSYTGRRDRIVNTLQMVNINSIGKR